MSHRWILTHMSVESMNWPSVDRSSLFWMWKGHIVCMLHSMVVVACLRDLFSHVKCAQTQLHPHCRLTGSPPSSISHIPYITYIAKDSWKILSQSHFFKLLYMFSVIKVLSNWNDRNTLSRKDPCVILVRYKGRTGEWGTNSWNDEHFPRSSGTSCIYVTLPLGPCRSVHPPFYSSTHLLIPSSALLIK